MSEQSYYKINGIQNMPTLKGSCIKSLSDVRPSGTYSDILFSADMANAGNSRYYGNLTTDIHNYDMITVFPGHSNAEGAIGSKFSPKDLDPTCKTHLFTLAGQGAFYLVDQIMDWTNGSSFSAYPVNNSISSTCQFYNATVSGTTSKNWRPWSQYTLAHCGISKIIGTKYYGNRDLLYSANPMDKITLCNLSNPITAYDKIQVHVACNYSGISQYEGGGWWTEVYNNPNKLTGFRATAFNGGGGAGYLCQLPCKVVNATRISACNVGYSFKWFLNSTSTPIRSTQGMAGLTIQEIYGVKDA